VVRWERIAACFEAFLAVATIHIWISRLILKGCTKTTFDPLRAASNKAAKASWAR